tara:strand:- start:152 stop:775 length:624 start_codon:yes stop_codon:yes gene_type:complete
MTEKLWSPIQGLQFYPSMHRYRMNKKWMMWSISQIIDTRDQRTKEIHERTRSEWEPRGNTVHACLEAFLQGKPYDPGKYKDWVVPLLSDDLWNRWTAVACEFRLVDLDFVGGIGGSADCIIRHNETGRLVLADLKTLSASGRKRNVSLQLGGYLSLLSKCRPEIKIHKCMVIWSKPNEVLTTSYTTQECLTAYEKQKQIFFENLPKI